MHGANGKAQCAGGDGDESARNRAAAWRRGGTGGVDIVGSIHPQRRGLRTIGQPLDTSQEAAREQEIPVRATSRGRELAGGLRGCPLGF